MTEPRLTLIGGPTALLEIGPFRLLTDPVLDPPGGHYRFFPGMSSRKLTGPALEAGDLGRIDAVLLSHEHHADNLDTAGRELLPHAGRVLTTETGAKRLGGNAEGFAPWATTTLERDGQTLTLTATPARHGPPLSEPLTGPVVGFVIEGDALRGPDGAGTIYWTGDTVMYRGVEEVGRRFDVDVALINLGRVRFPLTGPARYTMGASAAVRAAAALRPRLLVPLHFEGWAHFAEDEATARDGLAAADCEVRWPVRGGVTELGRGGVAAAGGDADRVPG